MYKRQARFCGSLFIILDSVDEVFPLLLLKALDIDLEEMILEGRLEEAILCIQQFLGSDLKKYKWGMSVNLKEQYLSALSVVLDSLGVNTLIVTQDTLANPHKLLSQHPNLRVLSDLSEDEHSNSDVYIQDKDIVTLSYLMDCVTHKVQKNKSCILMHKNLQGMMASILVDVSCALNITHIFISYPRSEAAMTIYNQLIRMKE